MNINQGDTGSPLGRFWFDIVKKPNETRFNMSQRTAFLANFWTRLTCGVLYALSIALLGFTGTFLGWFIGSIIIISNTLIWAVFVKNEGMIGSFLLEEVLIGAGLGVGAFISVIL